MAGNAIQITFAGDASSLDRTFKNVGAGAQAMGDKLDAASADARSFGSTMDGVGSAVGGAESKFMGTADFLDGLGGAFGLPTEGATGLMRAFGDLSGGFEVVQGLFTSGVGKITAFGQALVSASTYTKIWTGIQAAFNAVMALNPAILITAAIVALGAALVVAYQKSETFRRIVQGAFDAVRGAAEGIWHFIRDLPGKLLGIAGRITDTLTAPYKAAFGLIAKAWNNTVGKLRFTLPSWVPGLGGKGFEMPNLPEFHTGGLVGQGMTPGTEVPAMLLAGETVLPPGRAAASTQIVVNVHGSVITDRDLGRVVADAIRNNKLIGVM